MEISRETLSLLNHRHAGQFPPRAMQFPDSAAHAGHADHIQAESAHYQHQRNQPPPVDSRHASMGEDGDEERHQSQEYDDHSCTAHREQHSRYSAHSRKGPEPGRIIKEAERGDLETESHQKEQRQTESTRYSRSPACRMRPHDPGITNRKKEQSRAAHHETKPGIRSAHQRGYRKVQADQKPEMLVKPPDGEGDTTLSDHFIVRLDSLLARVLLCSP